MICFSLGIASVAAVTYASMASGERSPISMKDVYRLIDAKGRVYLPKELRDSLGLEPGGIVKMAAEKGCLRLRKVHLTILDKSTKG